MVINHNISAIFAHRQFKVNNWELDKNIEHLASGLRITRAADDASGLAVSEKMRTQIRGLRRAEMNAEDAMSFIQTTEGYLQQTTEILQRIRELAIQAGNGIYSDEDRRLMQIEVNQLVQEVQRVASQAEFNGLRLFTGRFSAEGGTAVAFHIGPNMDQRILIHIENMTAQALGLMDQNGNITVSLSTATSANQVIGTIDQALSKILGERAKLGAYENRLDKITKQIMVTYENLQAAESRIRDTDMAEEVMNFVRNQILSQASVAMLAQANLKPQLVLRLLY